MTTPLKSKIREAAGLEVKQGPFGMSLKVTRAFRKDDSLLTERRQNILVREFPSMEAFEAEVRQGANTSYLLQHSVPSISGPVITMAEESPFSYLNHSHTPNVAAPYHHSDIDRADRLPTDEFKIVALRDIADGEYLCFDYNQCVSSSGPNFLYADVVFTMI